MSCAGKLHNSNTLILKASPCPFVGYNANANAYKSRYRPERQVCTNAFAMYIGNSNAVNLNDLTLPPHPHRVRRFAALRSDDSSPTKHPPME